jgi:antitoxin YefM
VRLADDVTVGSNAVETSTDKHGGTPSSICLHFAPLPGRLVVVTVLPFTDARNRLSELIDEVQRTHERVEITRHGHAVAVLVSPDDLAALEETLEVLTSRDVMRQLAESREAVDAGDVLDADDLAALMAKRVRDTERPRAT